MTNQQNSTKSSNQTSRSVFTFWVRDRWEALPLIEKGIDVRQFGEEYQDEGSDHYAIVDCRTKEADVKALGYRYPGRLRVCVLRTSYLSDLLVSGLADTVDHILSGAEFDDWCKEQANQPISLDDAVEVAKVAIANLERPNKELAGLRKRCCVTSSEWTAIVDDLKDGLKGEVKVKQENSEDERLRLALLDIVQEKNSIARTRKRAQICSHYRLSKQEVEGLVGEMLTKTTSQGSLKRLSFDDLMALETEQLEWMIPELLPKGEMIILCGDPKAGKTLMATDAAFAIVTGESDFLGIRSALGKVLFISNDESEQSTKAKLLKRGFRQGDGQRLEIINNWTIERLYELELTLDEFRPDVVIFDSLKSISANSEISENSAEFANNIYALKNLLTQYKCAGILIHHSNKNPDAMGVGKLRGSTAIAGAVWGIWQLSHVPKPDPNGGKRFIIDPEDPNRILSVFARDIGGQTIKCELDPENNSYARLDAEIIEEQAKLSDRIISILKINPQGLRGVDVVEVLGMKDQRSAVYKALNRMVAKKSYPQSS